MKNLAVILFLSAATLLGGCATGSGLMKKSGVATRNDVFVELADGGSIPQGYADLRISSSLKTHKPGEYSTRDLHGTPEHQLLINIDGQVTRISGDLREETTGPSGQREPEAGEGIRYRFGKSLRLKSGTHKVTIAIVEDEIAVEREITLAEGSRNSLVLEPIYRAAPGKRRPGFYGVTSFQEGIAGLQPVLNGNPI